MVYTSSDKMASKTLLFLLGLMVIAVAYGAVLEAEEEEFEFEDEEQLTYEDFQDHFMEKRGAKIGSKFWQCNFKNSLTRRVC